MKRLLIAATTALMMTTAHADEVCANLGEYARTVMESRQLGVPLSKVMAVVKDADIPKKIALDAYEQPRFQSEEFRQTAIEDFGNKWETLCYRVRSKKGTNV
jgi:hypothetical protein